MLADLILEYEIGIYLGIAFKQAAVANIRELAAVVFLFGTVIFPADIYLGFLSG